jgi:cyclophilin family peptidyl-prolyl cis-trans isomerase
MGSKKKNVKKLAKLKGTKVSSAKSVVEMVDSTNYITDVDTTSFQNQPVKVTGKRLDSQKIGNLVWAFALFTLTVWLGFFAIPGLYDRSTVGAEELSKQQTEATFKKQEEQKVKETEAIKGKTKVILTTNYGDLSISLGSQTTGITDNFLRLSYRGKYDNNLFHRMVKTNQDNGLALNIIQAGDYDNAVKNGGDKLQEKRFGKGGGAALNPTIKDEIWAIAPEYSPEGKLINSPVFLNPELYTNFQNLDNGASQVTYAKGVLAMANESAAGRFDTNGSQFFINITDSVLAPQYTAFAKIDESSFPVLDKINSEINPKEISLEGDEKITTPDKELYIISAKIQ